MQLSKKKIVGLGGLALVAGITAVAANVPAGAVSVGGAVDIVVEVYSINYSTEIESQWTGLLIPSQWFNSKKPTLAWTMSNTI